jgi:hypothetical protein
LAEVDLENQDRSNAICMERGFLIVGSGLNGDPIAVELSSEKMAFLSHDILFESTYDDFEDGVVEFEECLLRTPLGFHEFWQGASDVPNFPRDSYDAEELWGTR